MIRHVRDNIYELDGRVVVLANPDLSDPAANEAAARKVLTEVDSAPQPPPPDPRFQDLQASDAGMARAAEDIAVALLTGAPVPLAARDKINARRKLRGEAPI